MMDEGVDDDDERYWPYAISTGEGVSGACGHAEAGGSCGYVPSP